MDGAIGWCGVGECVGVPVDWMRYDCFGMPLVSSECQMCVMYKRLFNVAKCHGQSEWQWK